MTALFTYLKSMYESLDFDALSESISDGVLEGSIQSQLIAEHHYIDGMSWESAAMQSNLEMPMIKPFL